MENNFVPYELALKLKELGLDEECLGFYTELENLVIKENVKRQDCSKDKCIAPLWQQSFDWFRKEKDLYADIYRTGNLFSANIEDMLMGNSLCGVCKEINYEEARLECLKKLIEIAKEKCNIQ